jgi:protein-tyrosine phosphatase
MFNRILIICIGNICRSPMGEALLADNLEKRGIDAVVHSAGLGALVDHPADPMSQELMQERGIDLSQHRARQLTPAMVMDYDLILTMEEEHVKAIEAMVPGARGRAHSIGKWGEFDIPDPYKQSRKAFEHALQLIERGLNDWQQKIWK